MYKKLGLLIILIDITNQNSITWESFCLSKLTNETKKVIIGNVYRTPREINLDQTECIDELNNTIKNLEIQKLFHPVIFILIY